MFENLGDPKYALFIYKLTKTQYEIIGVRMPIIHKKAKEVTWNEALALFVKKDLLSEELLLIGCVIARECKNVLWESWSEIAVQFLQKVDSWHYVDSFVSCMKWIVKNDSKRGAMRGFLLDGLYAQNEFLCRFCIVMLFRYYPECTNELLERFLDFNKECPYYVKIAAAWGVSEIYFRDSQKILEFLPRLECGIRKMSIQKICQSKRISQKEFLKSL